MTTPIDTKESFHAPVVSVGPAGEMIKVAVTATIDPRALVRLEQLKQEREYWREAGGMLKPGSDLNYAQGRYRQACGEIVALLGMERDLERVNE